MNTATNKSIDHTTIPASPVWEKKIQTASSSSLSPSENEGLKADSGEFDHVLKKLQSLTTNSHTMEINNLVARPTEIETALNDWISKLPQEEQHKGGLAKQRILSYAGNCGELNLSNLSLTSVPGKALALLPDLNHLDLSGNLLTILPDELNLLEKLEYIFLDNNKLYAFPEVIKNMKALQACTISHNQLSMLPEWLTERSVAIKVDYNLLPTTDDPENSLMNKIIDHMRSVVALRGVKSTRKETIEYFFYPQWMPEQLLVKNEPITFQSQRDEGITGLENLLEPWVKAHASARQSIKSDIEEAYRYQLNALMIHRENFCPNGEWFLPPITALLQLQYLTSLSLSFNYFRKLPTELNQLTNLKKLDITNNRLRILPKWLSEMPNLEVLLVDNNCLKLDDQGIPVSVFDKYFKQLAPKEWIQMHQGAGIDDFNSLKESKNVYICYNPGMRIKPISDEEREAMKEYYGGVLYKEINAYQRSLNSNDETITYSEDEKISLGNINKNCNLYVKKYIASGMLPVANTILFRSVSLPNLAVDKLIPGAIYQPHQLVSTSTNLNLPLHPEISKKAPHGWKNVLFVIESSNHLAAVIHAKLEEAKEIKTVESHEIEVFKVFGENELIFPIETQFQVIKAQQNGDFYQVHLTAPEELNRALLAEIDTLRSGVEAATV
jgi:Leucine-rich repeat (LRR) protein